MAIGIITLLLLFLSPSMQAQQLVYKVWEQTSGMPDTVDWSAHVKDASGNLYVTGNTIAGTELANVLTTVYDRFGTVKWQTEYNGSYDHNDYGTAIAIDDDKNVFVAATTFSSATNYYDYLVIKYDSTGTEQWTATYNGPGSLFDIPSDILVDTSGNVYVTGGSQGSGTGYDYATIKYNASGTQQWVSRYNYNDNDDAASGLAINTSGQVVVSGASAQATDNWDFATVKYHKTTGTQLALQRSTASGLGIDRVNDLAIDAADNIYLTGRAAITGEGYNIRTVKLDSLLSTVWVKTHDLAEGDDTGNGIRVDTEGYVYVCGEVTSEEGATHAILIRYEEDGTVDWTKVAQANNGEYLDIRYNSISLTDDEQTIAVTGNSDNGSNTDMVLHLYDTAGTAFWKEIWDGSGQGDDAVYFVSTDSDNEIFLGGKAWNGTTDENTFIKYKLSDYITPPDDDPDKPAYAGWWENKGQIIDTDENSRTDIRYYTDRHYPALYATDDSLFMVFSRIDTSTATDDTLARIDMGFVGSSTTKEIMKATSQGGEYRNFFLAHTGADGVTNVQKADKLYTKSLYSKVDLMHYFDQAGVKFYLIIQPGYSAQNDPIEMAFNGASITFNADTTLTLETDIGGITLRKPEAYQIESDGSRTDLTWHPEYTDEGSGVVGLSLGSYTTSKVLVLEYGFLPVELAEDDYYEGVYWSTVYGIYNSGDKIVDCQYFSDGNPVFLLQSQSLYFPESQIEYSIGDLTGLTDIAIHKFDDHRASWWTTYWGGSLSDYPTEMVVHQTKGFYVTGYTSSDDFYTNEFSGGYFEDTYSSVGSQGFITRINGYGTSSDWSTYVEGTSHLYTIGFARDLDEFSVGGRIETGASTSEIHLLDPGGDAFYEADSDGSKAAFSYIASFQNSDLSAIWATKYWGIQISSLAYDEEIISGSMYDRINIGGLITDAFYFETLDATDGGNAIGESFDFGEGELDPYFATFRYDKELVWATPYGGDGQDYIEKLVRGEWGNTGNNIYALGRAGNNIGETDMTWPAETIYTGTEYYYKDEYTDIVSPSVHSYDGYIIKFNYDRDIVFSTLFGGDGSDEVYDAVGFINPGNSNSIWFTGRTNSDNSSFPYTSLTGYYSDQDDLEAINPGDYNAFISVVANNSVLEYTSYYGNTQNTESSSISTQPFGFDNHMITAGALEFQEDESDGFLPLWSLYADTYFLETNPTGNDAVFTQHITEWGPFSIVGSVDEYERLSSYLVYPNPATDWIMIDSNHESIDQLTIYSIDGRINYYNENYIHRQLIQVSELIPGLYIIEIMSDNMISQIKFIKL